MVFWPLTKRRPTETPQHDLITTSQPCSFLNTIFLGRLSDLLEGDLAVIRQVLGRSPTKRWSTVRVKEENQGTKMDFLADIAYNCEKRRNCKFDKLNDFRERGLFFDVTFIVEGAEVRAHKIVLSARSEVFETMFTTPMTEASLGVVNITDATKEAFETFLGFIYSNSASDEAIDDHYAELIYLADKYSVQHIISRCEDRLKSDLGSRSVVELLSIAESFKLSKLKETLLSHVFVTGNELINSNDFAKLTANFCLTELVVSSIKPSSVSESFNISPDFWNFDKGEKLIKMRNNGNIVIMKVTLKNRRKTLYGYMELENDCYWPVEMSFKFSISRTDGSLMHSGEGDVWWEALPQNWEELEIDYDRQPKFLFEYFHKSKVPIKNLRFVFSITLSQWAVANRIFSKRKVSECDCKESKEVMKGVTEFSDIEKTSLMRAIEGGNGCTDGIDVTTLQILRQHVSSGLLPKESDVSASLVREAHKLLLTELVEHCEQAIASRVDSESVVEILILARQLDLLKLEYTALEFINFHHLEVLASIGWPLLKGYPEIVASVLKKLLAKPLPNESMPPGISDFESSED